MVNQYEVAIVGGGVAGLSAAYTLAKAGVEVVLIERGQASGAKNVMGGVLYRQQMEEIIPEFYKEAPLERPIVEQRFWLMGKKSVTQAAYKYLQWSQVPYNNFTVFRSKFDQWFAGKCIQAGALIINDTVATECIIKNNKVVGVKTNRDDGDIYANVVILADGVNSLLGKQLGFHKEWKPTEVALAVMEELKLPAEKIEERFNLDKGMGATIEIYGESTQNMMGTSFIYTNKEHLSIGCGILLSQLVKSGLRPYDVLEKFKNHPLVSPYVRGAEAAEYYAHLIPEGGYHSIPRLVGDGVLVVGDAAQFVNGIHREGSNLAMMSGRLAAEAILLARKVGEYDERTLSVYRNMLNDSFVIKDLKKYKNTTHIMEKNPSYFSYYLPAVNRAVREMLVVDGKSKWEKQILVIKRFFQGRRLLKGVWELFKLGRSMK